MTDKEILKEVYRRLQDFSSGFRREGHLGVNRYDIKDFIEQEWQKADDQELVDQHNRNRSPKDWIADIRELERYRGLEIREDGTVTGLK